MQWVGHVEPILRSMWKHTELEQMREYEFEMQLDAETNWHNMPAEDDKNIDGVTIKSFKLRYFSHSVV